MLGPQGLEDARSGCVNLDRGLEQILGEVESSRCCVRARIEKYTEIISCITQTDSYTDFVLVAKESQVISFAILFGNSGLFYSDIAA